MISQCLCYAGEGRSRVVGQLANLIRDDIWRGYFFHASIKTREKGKSLKGKKGKEGQKAKDFLVKKKYWVRFDDLY